MPFKILYRGLEVVCESIQDIDALADSLERKSQPKVEAEMTKIAPTQKPDESTFLKTNSSFNESEKIATFINNLSPNALGVLQSLANTESGLTDTELREILKIDKKVVLAGLMSSIAKSATSVGLTFEKIVTKTITDTRHGKRKYHYVLNEEVKKEILK